jgi:hypothetical protein
MAALYAPEPDTLTSRGMINSYISVYQAVHGKKPDCQDLGNSFFMINGVRHDRRWLILEIERLRQEALTSAFDTTKSSSALNIFKLIRRLSSL